MQLFDLHCDTLGLGAHKGVSIQQHTGHVDLHRGAAFRPWVQAFAAFLPDGLTPDGAYGEYTALRDTVHRWAGETPAFQLLGHGEQPSAAASCNALLTVENAGVLADVYRLDELVADGVRLVGLTWNGDNPWACGCHGSGVGLTAAGKGAVQRLNEAAIPVDVSHLNEPGFWQVARLSTLPLVASHSNAAAVCLHPRNLSDDQFRAIRDSGGVVGLNLYPVFLGGDSLEYLRRHLEHFLSLGGEKTVAFGADFDGMTPPNDWNGLAVMERIWLYLQDCGYSLDFLADLFYNNANRILLG